GVVMAKAARRGLVAVEPAVRRDPEAPLPVRHDAHHEVAREAVLLAEVREAARRAVEPVHAPAEGAGPERAVGRLHDRHDRVVREALRPRGVVAEAPERLLVGRGAAEAAFPRAEPERAGAVLVDREDASRADGARLRVRVDDP